MLSPRNLLATLIVVSTVLFVVAVSIEKAESGHEEPAHVEAGESGHDEEDEEIFGIEPESTPLIVLAAVAFAVFDVAEAGHLVEESEGGLVVIAVLVGALHLAAAWVAFSMRRQLAAAPA